MANCGSKSHGFLLAVYSTAERRTCKKSKQARIMHWQVMKENVYLEFVWLILFHRLLPMILFMKKCPIMPAAHIKKAL